MTDKKEPSRRTVLKSAGVATLSAAGVYGFAGSASATDSDSSTPSGDEISTAESCNTFQVPCDWTKQDQESYTVPGGSVTVTLVTGYYYDYDVTDCSGAGQKTFRFEENDVTLSMSDDTVEEIERAVVETTFTIEGSNLEVTWPPVFETTSGNQATIRSEYDAEDLDAGWAAQEVGEIEEQTDCKWLNPDSIDGGEVETTVTLDFGSTTETFFADTSVSGL